MMFDNGQTARERLVELINHFFSSPALPAFAWIKAIELLILATVAASLKMVAVAILFTLAWVYVFDDIEEVAEDAIDE